MKTKFNAGMNLEAESVYSRVKCTFPEAAFLLVSILLTLSVRGLWGRDCKRHILVPRAAILLARATDRELWREPG